MRNYVQPGDMITAPAPYDLASGDGCLVGALFGVSSGIVKTGLPAELKTTGVFGLKAAAPAGTQFAKAYWDNTNKVVTSVASGNTLIGLYTETKAVDATVAVVRLNGTSI